MTLINFVDNVKMVLHMIINLIVQFVQVINLIKIIAVSVLLVTESFKKKIVLKNHVCVQHVKKIIFICNKLVTVIKVYKIIVLVDLQLDLYC